MDLSLYERFLLNKAKRLIFIYFFTHYYYLMFSVKSHTSIVYFSHTCIVVILYFQHLQIFFMKFNTFTNVTNWMICLCMYGFLAIKFQTVYMELILILLLFCRSYKRKFTLNLLNFCV
jgi:hypothetical protein